METTLFCYYNGLISENLDWTENRQKYGEEAMEEEYLKSKGFDWIDMFHYFGNNLSYTNWIDIILDSL